MAFEKALDFVLEHEIRGCGVVCVGKDVAVAVAAGMARKMALDFALGHEIHGCHDSMDDVTAAAAGIALKMALEIFEKILDFVLGHEIHGSGVVYVGKDVAAAAVNK